MTLAGLFGSWSLLGSSAGGGLGCSLELWGVFRADAVECGTSDACLGFMDMAVEKPQ